MKRVGWFARAQDFSGLCWEARIWLAKLVFFFLLIVLSFVSAMPEVALDDFWLGAVIRFLTRLLADPSIRMCAAVCIAVMYVNLRFRNQGSIEGGLNGAVWLDLFFASVWGSYFLTSSHREIPSEPLVLSAASVAGLLARELVSHHRRGLQVVVVSLTGFYALLSLWPGSITRISFGEGVRRSGPFDDPNKFGLVAALGFVSAYGLIWYGIGGKRCGRHAGCFLAFGLLSVLCCGINLHLSHSRGALVAAALGMILLHFWQDAQETQMRNSRPSNPSRASSAAEKWREWMGALVASMIALTVAVMVAALASKSVPQTLDSLAFAASRYDLSLINRLRSWQGAFAMVSDRPIVGFGWPDLAAVYRSIYAPPSLFVTGSFETNGFLKLACAAGLPALLFLVLYISAKLREVTSVRLIVSSRQNMPLRYLRPVAVVLLAGFWFEDGLFTLPLAISFFVFLEMNGPH